MNTYEENRSKGLLVDGTSGLCLDIKQDFPNNKTTELPDMLASLPDVNPSVTSDVHGKLLSQLEKPNEVKLQKLSMNLRKFCSIRLRLPQSLKETDLHSLCVLNPEYQIKVLEDNLKYLQANKVKCNDDEFGGEAKQSLAISRPFTHTNSESHCKKETCCHDILGDSSNRSKEVGAVTNARQPRILTYNNLIIPGEVQNPRHKNHASCNSKDMKSSENNLFPNILPTLISNPATAKPLDNYCFKTLHSKTDNDNQFEFTLEQEKIVSFVCSPIPTRKERVDRKNYEGALHLDSDFDSDKRSEMSSIKEDTSSDSLSNSSTKSDFKINTFNTEHCGKWSQLPESKKLLWHPPLYQNGSEEPSKPSHTCIPQSPVFRSWQPESHTKLSNTLKLEHSMKQEAILFREASLRGCYSIENILRDEKLCSDLGFDVKCVRDSIFSAIRFQPKHESMIPDSVGSVLDILRAWVKLNSHFENKGFTDVLLRYGIELSVVSDFLKWQSVSRMFIDKMINAIQRITSVNNATNAVNRLGSANLNQIAEQSQIFDGLANHPMFLNSNGNLGQNHKESQNTCRFPRSEIIPNKHWKQRRFIPDQPKACLETKQHTQQSAPNIVNNISQLPCFSNVEHSWRPADVGLSLPNSYEISSMKNGDTLTSSKGLFQEIGQKFTKNHLLHSNNAAKRFDKSKPIKFHGTKVSNTDAANFNKDISSTSTVKHSNAAHMDGNCSISSSVQFQNKIPLHNHQALSTNNDFGQPNISQPPLKQNPIHCVDNDGNEISMKNSYIKPGVYIPPQKLLALEQLVKTKNITIEDTPVVGIPVLYWPNTENPIHESKTTSKLSTCENGCDGKCHDTWKAAVSLAESLRDNLLNSKTESDPNLKLSETISLKTHFLLSDEASQNSSSTDLKLYSDTEESTQENNILEENAISQDTKFDILNGWFKKSLDKVMVENGGSMYQKKVNETRSTNYELTESRTNANCCYENKSSVAQDNGGDDHESSDHINNELSSHNSVNPQQSNQTLFFGHFNQTSNAFISSFSPKKVKKHKKVRSSYPMDSYEQKASLLYKQPKSVFKRSITKQVISKLQSILDCVWNAGVSSLVEESLTTDQDAILIELKIRGPLYLQAMRCKLTNHSYDTLEQALYDFHQYFIELKNRNKGDKQCEEVVGVLEQMFFDLVETNFGPMCHFQPQYFNSVGINSSVKARRQKKSLRKC